jgi:hypothetical protein
MALADAATLRADLRGPRAIYHAYRRWALGNRIDFQLIYGNPIPGYIAPSEVTVSAVIKRFRAFLTAAQ